MAPWTPTWAFVFIICGVSCVASFTILTPATDYATAVQRCIDIGMQLFTIKDSTAYAEVSNYLGQASVPGELWVGMYWDPATSVFRWADDNAEITNSLTWGSSEPNCMTSAACCCGSPYQECVRMTTSGYKLKTIYCSSNYYPLCQNGLTETTEPTSTSKPSSTNVYTQLFTSPSSTCEPCDPDKICPSYLPKETTVPTCNCIVPSTSRGNQSMDTSLLYKVERKKTGAYKRQHTSAHDDRFSAKMIGYTGVIILICFGSMFVVVDLLNVASYKNKTKLQKRKKTNNL